MEECIETNNEVKLAKITLCENENKHKCSSCTLHIVLFSRIFTINVGIAINFVYSHWYLKNDDASVLLNARTETTLNPYSKNNLLNL